MKAPPPLPDEPVIVAAAGPLVIKQRPAHSRNYASRIKQYPRRIVIHCTDGHEGYRKDDDVAAMFADPDLGAKKGGRRSAHYVVDSDSVTRCVDEIFPAWHCGPSGNRDSIGIELCGRASQARREWLDTMSLPMLALAARLVAEICVRRAIPCRLVAVRGLLADEAGITTHSFVADAWRDTRHHDPGPGFPLAAFIRAAAAAIPQVRPPRS
jgi:N-acetyl-anhydromuramyl-L-alanine amidase AmpD